ncbi:uncharacterized protein E0L32_006547 [Thyridium curvatum]|uniref:Transcription initiation factor IIA subunit 2 n=1 Tax=Thyridium curvatum TaxID=1093900 RepID=A0A507B7S3_9PEZI|nr:uncharacterized protein E0L32_006547 [Thyridium curvatum]TPX13121.1 hypothetical protein E0L32_006547 [Thyridium curvatum]
MATPSFYELYRRSSIGYALTDTLDDLISENRIDPQLAMKILANFDRAIAETLQDKVKSRLTFKVNSPHMHAWAISIPRASGPTSAPQARFGLVVVMREESRGESMANSKQGSLDTYRFCDEVWTFLIKNVSFKMENGGSTVTADKIKIVSCNARPANT